MCGAPEPRSQRSWCIQSMIDGPELVLGPSPIRAVPVASNSPREAEISHAIRYRSIETVLSVPADT